MRSEREGDGGKKKKKRGHKVEERKKKKDGHARRGRDVLLSPINKRARCRTHTHTHVTEEALDVVPDRGVSQRPNVLVQTLTHTLQVKG